MEKEVDAAKARKPANQAHMLATEEEKETVKLVEPNEHDVENTMDSEPDLADVTSLTLLGPGIFGS